ncbi:MAG TPA: glycosyltransferase family 4 protein [Planctomycetota bacterium]|jgi:glycosyltransferase involved in cell wall biosynthesis|nr:glycosyltransferase family 4 protein [Planctomycetota bacterium]
MKSIHVLPGSGDNFYCENCVRDNATVRALVRAKEDVVAIPMYLPQIVDRVDEISQAPVFYGGINSYLQQVSGFFRWTPRWVDRLFDSRWMLKLAAKRAGSVRARGLGELTLSVMKGADGRQVKELGRLLHWLDGVERPDLVHLSTPLLMGIGLAIRKRFDIPVVCTVHDEDVWIDAMEEPWRSRCWETMAEGGRDVAAFISLSRWYGDLMQSRLKIDPAKMHVIPVGVEAGPAPSGAAPNPPTIGYLARMAESMGLPLLVEAYVQLKKTEKFKSLRLHLCGGKTADDAAFLERLRRRFADEGVAGDVTFFDEFDPKSRRAFLEKISVLTVPTPGGVAFGTYVLEANAAGVPVVEPRIGSYPELIEATGGGVLYEPNTADALARALGDLLGDEARRAELGRKGRESVERSFSLATMAQKMTELYRSIVPAAKVGEARRA